MFSGIVKGLEKASKTEKTKEEMRLSIPIPKGWNIKSGESISIDGICSTVTKAKNGTFSVYYMPETIRKTNLSTTLSNHFFNLEQSLRLNDLVGGHLVSGHIDTVARIKSIKNEGEAKVVTFSIDSFFTKYIIYKGSIAVNGVSLTVVDVNKDSFVVSLIPYTLEHTNLGTLKINDLVNIELDLIAKYLEKITKG